MTSTPFDETDTQISPDGRWVAYASNEPGSREVFVQSFPAPGVKRQISVGGGRSPRWSRDGQELFYLSLEGRLMAVPLQAASGSLDAGVPVGLFETRISAGETEYAVSADGRFLINLPADDAAAPVTVVLNWMGGAKRE